MVNVVFELIDRHGFVLMQSAIASTRWQLLAAQVLQMCTASSNTCTVTAGWQNVQMNARTGAAADASNAAQHSK